MNFFCSFCFFFCSMQSQFTWPSQYPSRILWYTVYHFYGWPLTFSNYHFFSLRIRQDSFYLRFSVLFLFFFRTPINIALNTGDRFFFLLRCRPSRRRSFLKRNSRISEMWSRNIRFVEITGKKEIGKRERKKISKRKVYMRNIFHVSPT